MVVLLPSLGIYAFFSCCLQSKLPGGRFCTSTSTRTAYIFAYMYSTVLMGRSWRCATVYSSSTALLHSFNFSATSFPPLSFQGSQMNGLEYRCSSFCTICDRKKCTGNFEIKNSGIIDWYAINRRVKYAFFVLHIINYSKCLSRIFRC